MSNEESARLLAVSQSDTTPFHAEDRVAPAADEEKTAELECQPGGGPAEVLPETADTEEEARLSLRSKIIAVAVVTVWIFIGTLIGMVCEGWTFGTSLYFVVQVLTTVGYGDILVHGRVFHILMAIYIVTGVLFVAVVVNHFMEEVVANQSNRMCEQLHIMAVRQNMQGRGYSGRLRRGVYEVLMSVGLAVVWLVCWVAFFRLYEGCTCGEGIMHKEGCVPERCADPGPNEEEGYILTTMDAMYMGVVTMTMVGFGDFSPRTRLGRCLACPFMMAGVGAVARVITSLAKLQNLERYDTKRKSDVFAQRLWRKMDLDGNGQLTCDEFTIFMLMHHGVITIEQVTRVQETFKMLDTNKDGCLSQQEIIDGIDWI